MTKQDVVKVLGSPTSCAAPGAGEETLRYTFVKNYTSYDAYYPQDYFVTLLNGRVVRYGRVGDYHSTIDPTINYNIKNR